MKKLFGVITAMVTPFDDNDKVDVKAVAQLTDYLIQRKVHCLYPTGTTGEMFLMSVDERKKVAETVVKTAAGRAVVYIHTGAMTLKDTIELSRHAKDIGADGVGVVTPAYFGVNDREMAEYYEAVSKSLPADYPVYLYGIPQCAANDLKTDVVKGIVARCPNIVGIKYSYSDMLRVSEYLQVKNGDFSVVVGTDRLFLPGLSIGCDGTVSGISCVVPEPFVAVYEAFKKGDFATARKMQRAAYGFCELLRNGSNMGYFKAALKFRGVDAGHMRRPLMDIPAAEAAELTQKLEAQLKELSIPVR
ncbi:MAG: dihydrodipicolinate synthase family protein [Treponemataceae bacterium]